MSAKKKFKQDLPGLVAWLRTKPARGTYSFFDNDNCVLAQFLKACGYREPDVGGYSWRASGSERDIPGVFRKIAHGECGDSWTFGGALKRAEKALAEWRASVS